MAINEKPVVLWRRCTACEARWIARREVLANRCHRCQKRGSVVEETGPGPGAVPRKKEEVRRA